MEVKKEYAVGDTVWIYGITKQNKLTEGKVIKVVDLSNCGFECGPHYIISIPTYIEPLLEIRTWEDISQDDKGPVGAFRALTDLSSTVKKTAKLGFVFDGDEDDEPTEAEIHAAIEKATKDTRHGPLVLKENKPKRRYYKRKKNG